MFVFKSIKKDYLVHLGYKHPYYIYKHEIIPLYTLQCQNPLCEITQPDTFEVFITE